MQYNCLNFTLFEVVSYYYQSQLIDGQINLQIAIKLRYETYLAGLPVPVI